MELGFRKREERRKEAGTRKEGIFLEVLVLPEVKMEIPREYSSSI